MELPVSSILTSLADNLTTSQFHPDLASRQSTELPVSSILTSLADNVTTSQFHPDLASRQST